MRRSLSKRSLNRNDIVIVGAGPSGLTLALLLGRAGISTICIEQDHKKAKALKDKTKIDLRTTALSYASVEILKECGLWQELRKEACPILDIRVADGKSPSILDFHHNEVGQDPFGWIVENRLFHGALQTKVRAQKSVKIIEGQVQNLEINDEEAIVQLEDGRSLKTSLVIGADGRNSFCRKAASIGVYGWSYKQTAIICTLQHESPHGFVAVEHFLPGGPLATLPMQGNRSSVVWTERTAAANHLMQMKGQDFRSILQAKVGSWLGHIELIGPRFCYPLQLQHAEHYTAKRMALIGDAAHGIHPIAGQGFNLGMGDIASLKAELLSAARLGLDLGTPLMLKRFERSRRFANGNMVLMTDLLDRLFSNSIPPIEGLRRAGLGAVQQIGPLRRFFMRQAMGRGKAA